MTNDTSGATTTNDSMILPQKSQPMTNDPSAEIATNDQ